MSAAALAALCGCRGCGTQIPSPPPAAPPTATLARVAPAAATAPPDHYIIVFGDADPNTGPAPLAVHFTAEDPFKNIDEPQYRWDFGDGSPPSEQRSPNHVYARPGAYTARLTVTDSAGVVDEDTVDIEVKEPAGEER